MARKPPHTRVLGDMDALIAFLRQTHVPAPPSANEEAEDTSWRVRQYERFTDLDPEESYYRIVSVCKLLYRDLASGASRAHLERYAPGIAGLDVSALVRIRYDAEAEEYVILAKGAEYRIYRGDIRYLYPLYCIVPDAAEYELAYDGEDVVSYSLISDTDPIPVFSQ